jgi:hypothetical protein
MSEDIPGLTQCSQLMEPENVVWSMLAVFNLVDIESAEQPRSFFSTVVLKLL